VKGDVIGLPANVTSAEFLYQSAPGAAVREFPDHGCRRYARRESWGSGLGKTAVGWAGLQRGRADS